VIRKYRSSVLTGISFFIGVLPAFAEPRLDFLQPFAPSEGLVPALEHPFRQEVSLDGRWQFQPVKIPDDYKRGTGAPPELPLPDAAKWESTPLKIPSPWNVNTWGNGRNAGAGTDRPYVADSLYYPSYPASWDGVEMGWMRRSFQLPAGDAGARVVLHFEAVAGEAQVWVNGKLAGSHFDSFLPFDFDLTDLVKRDGANELLVGVRKSSLFNIISPNYPPGQQRTYPNGSNMDNLVGIWNDVSLLMLPAVRVDGVFIQPLVDEGVLRAEVTLRNDSDHPQNISLGGEVSPWINLAGGDVLSAPVPKWKLDAPVLSLSPATAMVPAGKSVKVILQVQTAGRLKTWSPSAPNLYGLVLSTKDEGQGVVDRKYVRFGWRQFKIHGRDLLLNGEKIQLWGDFGHPFGPFISSRRYIWADYRMIKDVGGNAVRPHANIMPRAWLDLADEMGLCVLDESSIFGSSINLNLQEPVTWTRFASHLDGLVLRDRNHPSVFGWSSANEMFALFFKTSEEGKKEQYAKLKELAMRPQALDPTREWISVDGDKDLDGTLPVWSRHIGIGVPDDLPNSDKPRMIGEQGGTYYAGPPRLREVNGERSYESYAARNEALGIDLYRMITQVAKPQLTAFSPSELIWFGLEHLPFGYRTVARPPDKTDGIFFPNYVEGVPGVQIERLPPYVTTINPGFDPQLPMYKPMAMFDAMKAALDPRGPQPSPWDKLPAPIPKPVHAAPARKVAHVGFVGDVDGAIFNGLYNLGVPLVAGADAAKADLLIVDGEGLKASDAAEATRLAKAVWARGGLVWVMTRNQGAALPVLGGLLPEPVSMTMRKATSLVHAESSPLVDGFALSDLYFVVKQGGSDIARACLGGPLVDSGRVLLTASNSNWSLFEQQPEAAKCASMLIYERLQKPSGAALVEAKCASGKLWVSSLDAALTTTPATAFWKQLWKNLGVELAKPASHTLVATGADSASSPWRYTTEMPPADWMTPAFEDESWSQAPAGFGSDVPNAKAATRWRTGDIYLRQEFAVEQPPRSLTLTIYHDEDAAVYLNGVKVFAATGFVTNYRTVALGEKALKALKVGKNIIAVHCHQTTGGQFIDVGLSGGTLPRTTGDAGHDLLLDGPVN